MFDSERIVYKRVGDREVTALIYKPEDAGEKAPVCFWFHGGGWCVGDGHEPEVVPVLLRGMLEAGIRVVSCEYRLANGRDVFWPEVIGDCSDFVRYFAKNAGKYGLDMDRAFAAGISAGGHLALLEAFGGRYFGAEDGEAFPKFRFVLDMCGPVDMRLALEVGDSGAIRSLLRKFLGRDDSAWAEIYPRISPIDFARKLRAEDLPPVIAVQGTADEVVNPGQPLILGELYQKQGREFVLVEVENGSHGFTAVPGGKAVSVSFEELQRAQLDFALAHLY